MSAVRKEQVQQQHAALVCIRETVAFIMTRGSSNILRLRRLRLCRLMAESAGCCWVLGREQLFMSGEAAFARRTLFSHYKLSTHTREGVRSLVEVLRAVCCVCGVGNGRCAGCRSKKHTENFATWTFSVAKKIPRLPQPQASRFRSINVR